MHDRTATAQRRRREPPAAPPAPATAVVPWLAGPGPRRFFERTPLGVPIAAAVLAFGLGGGAAVDLVPSSLAWELGGPLALFAEAFALYGWIAWRRAREAAPPDDH